MSLQADFTTLIEKVEMEEDNYWILKVPTKNLKVGSKRLCDLVKDWLNRKGFSNVDCYEALWSDVDGEIIIDYDGEDIKSKDRILELTYLLLNRLDIRYININIDNEYTLPKDVDYEIELDYWGDEIKAQAEVEMERFKYDFDFDFDL